MNGVGAARAAADAAAAVGEEELAEVSAYPREWVKELRVAREADGEPADGGRHLVRLRAA